MKDTKKEVDLIGVIKRLEEVENSYLFLLNKYSGEDDTGTISSSFMKELVEIRKQINILKALLKND